MHSPGRGLGHKLIRYTVQGEGKSTLGLRTRALAVYKDSGLDTDKIYVDYIAIEIVPNQNSKAYSLDCTENVKTN